LLINLIYIHLDQPIAITRRVLRLYLKLKVMKKFTFKMLFLFFLLIGLDSHATIITANTGLEGIGNWNAPGTWDLGRIPACGDTIIIPAGVTVHIAANVDLDTKDCAPAVVQIYGKVNFANGRKLSLSAGGCVQIYLNGTVEQSGAGGGASEQIEIQKQTWWQASDGTLNGTAAGVNLGCGALLPVEMLDYSVENINEQVNITWTTGSERDNSFFTIERSKDGVYWENIGKELGSGTTTSITTYNYEDTNPYIGLSYYRLSQTNINGERISLGSISNTYSTSAFLVYPIPVNKMMFLEGTDLSHSKIKVLSSTGAEIYVEQTLIGDKIAFNFTEVKNGAYFVTIENDKTSKVERIIVCHK
jgi:hypothetical protein